MPKVINKQIQGYDDYVDSGNKVFPQLARHDGSYKPVKSGIYKIGYDRAGRIFFEGMSAMTDNLVDLPNFISSKVIKEINTFWTPDVRKRYDKYGMVYKRGILLHGKPGTGKSSIIARIMEAEIQNNGIIFFCPTPTTLYDAVSIIREIETDRKILVIFEELDKLLDSYEGDFLSILDGEMQIDNVVYIATTNYLDRIAPRIKNRPSRFASVIEVPIPDKETRKMFLEAKIPVEDKVDIEKWVKLTEGFTIDHIKDLIISVLCIGIDLEEGCKKLRDMNNSKDDFDIDDENDFQKNLYTNEKQIGKFSGLFED